MFTDSGKRLVIPLVVALVLIAVAVTTLVLRQSATERPPQRSFTTSDFLVKSLPGWLIESGPVERRPHDFNLKRAVAGSTIRFLKPPAGVNPTLTPGPGISWEPAAALKQWVVKFATFTDAATAFSDHYFVGGPVGSSTSEQWKAPAGLEARSEVAQEFRIVCRQFGPPPVGADCYLEARYDEFYVLAQYTATDAGVDDFLKDLSMIAMSVDSQVEKYIRAGQ